METLKVKDYGYSYGLIVACCIFPLVFFAIANFVNDYLITAAIAFSVYAIAFIFFVRNLRRTEDEYLIVADKEGVTFLKKGTFKWSEVSGFEAYAQIEGSMNRRYEAKYVRVYLAEGVVFTLKVTDCDYEYREIVEYLNKIGGLPSWTSIKQN